MQNHLERPVGLDLGWHRYNGEPADVVGSVETTPNGNIAIRIGGTLPDWYGGGWTQVGYIVLTPQEAKLLTDALTRAWGSFFLLGLEDSEALDALADDEDDEVEYHRLRGEAAAVREALWDDPFVSDQDYGRLVAEALDADERREWESEAGE